MLPIANNDKEAHAKRGVKRKRPSARKQEDPAEVIAKKLHHGLHEACKAAKKAQAFELRKLVKRLKAARTQDAKGKGNPKGEDAVEMERQLEVLKHAEHEHFGNTALRTKILKDGLLSRNDNVQLAVADKLADPLALAAPQAPGSAAAKVHGRLLSSKILADAVRAIVEALREVVDPGLAKKKRGVEESGEEREEEEDSGEEDEAGAIVGRFVTATRRGGGPSDEEEDNTESGSEVDVADADGAGWESGTVDDDDGAGWESGSSDISHEGNISVATSSDDDGHEEESGTELVVPAAKKARKAAVADAKSSGLGQSTFLPSLSVGFTRGDSDASDFSDGEVDDEPRKNRRGQRARRAIWEKKYGRNANHVKKQQNEARALQEKRQQKRQLRNGNQGGKDKSRKFQPSQQGRDAGYGGTNADGMARSRGTHVGSAGPGQAQAQAQPRGGARGRTATGAQGDQPLHPSWEAKKRLKEKMNPGILPAQGRKITFS